MDLSDVEARMTERTKAIVAVHLYGNAIDMPQLMALAARRRLAVVEDCANRAARPGTDGTTGTFGDVGCFSFYPTKNLGAYGDGGLCFTRRGEVAEAMRQFRVCGCDKAYYAEREGVNSRLDELQAAILDVKLRHLSDFIGRRQAIARVYREQLDPSIARQHVVSAVDHSYHLFVVAVERRDAVIARLVADEIGFGIHYPTPIHRMRAYQFLGYGEGSLSVTERLATQVLSLPCYPELAPEAARKVCSAVNDVIQAKD